ncbi:MAG: M24 family metallopeptidase [Acidimicrobiia bacterium]
MNRTDRDKHGFGPPYWRPGEFDQVDGFPRYPEQETARRRRWVEETMASLDLEVVVVGGTTGPLDTAVQYFTNWPPQVHSYVLFAPGEQPELVVRLWNHLPDARRIAVLEAVRYGGDTPADQAETVAAWLAGRRCRRAGLIGAVPHADYDAMRRRLPDTAFLDLNPDYQRLRLVKTEDEMVFTRIASRMNDAAVAAIASELRPGLNEYEIAKIVEDAYLAHRGVNLIHFSLTTPMEDPLVCVPHQHNPDRTIEAGDVLVTEISTTFWGYAGQILRTFTVAADPTPRYARLHDVAMGAYHALVERLRPGATVGDLLDAAEMIHDSGFDIWDDLVHGFGGAYLPPIVRTRRSRGATHPDDFPYPDGTLLVVQPNVIDGDAGVQVGNSMWLTGDGVEVTQAYPTALVRC